MLFIADEKKRIDRWLSENTEYSRSLIQNLCQSKQITVNGKEISKNYMLSIGDKIIVIEPKEQVLDVYAQNIPIDIVYEDEDILIVNKSKGMVVHPAPGNYENTLVNALMYHCDNLSAINGIIRPGIVHRIDKNTSGLLIVAKNDHAHTSLSEQIKAHSLRRIYETVVYGNVKKDNGTIEAPIGRDKNNRKKMAVTYKNSRQAISHYEVIERYVGYTYMRFRLETGRTHQIRVHCAFIGHAVAGDDVYGPKKVITELKGQCLHAKTLGFVHPSSKRYMEFTSELPECFTKFLESIKY